MNRFFILFFVAVFITACKHDDGFTPTAEIDKTVLAFTREAGTDSFNLTSNADWVIEKNAEWLSLSKESGTGNASIEVGVTENLTVEPRQAKLTVKITGLSDIVIEVTQAKALETTGLYILSEGSFGTGKAELAFYDVVTEQISTKYFAAQNGGSPLGEVGNDLAIYGSKMYCVVSGGSGFESAVEIINPNTGVSQKRIKITDSQGVQIVPRNIEFHENKAYVTTHSNSIIRIDTASLEIDGRTAIGGSYAEGICKYNGNLYVCNSGYGTGTSISVVDIATFKETKTITVPQNPLAIRATPSGEIYFTTGDASWNGGGISNLHVLNPATSQVTSTLNVRASRIALSRDFIYAVDFDWNTYEDNFCKINLATKAVTDLSDKIDITVVYDVSVNPLNNDVYLTNQGQNVVVLDKNDNEKFRIETGVAYTSKVVAIIN